MDPEVNFMWWDGAPRADMDDDNFGVRWTGFLAPKVTGKYQLGGVGMNAFEIYFNGKQLARGNNTHERNYSYETVDLEAGKLYPIRVDFHEVINDADMRLVWSVPGRDLEAAALDAARQAEAVVMFLGLSPRLEGEEMKVPVAGFQGGDRVDLGLPAAQEALLQKVVGARQAGRAGAAQRQRAGGELGARSRARAGGSVVSGSGRRHRHRGCPVRRLQPAGRLPVTFYQSADQLPAFDDYSMKGRTYRYFQGEPLYPFGYGLSYTTFGYSDLQTLAASRTGREPAGSPWKCRIPGRWPGEEVVQLYLKHVNSPVPVPVRSLQGFKRVSLKAGEKTRVDFTLDSRQLAYIAANGQRIVPPGEVEISVGGKQPGFTGPADAPTTKVITGRVQITGQPKLLD